MKNFLTKTLCFVMTVMMILCAVVPATAAEVECSAAAQQPHVFANPSPSSISGIDDDVLDELKELITSAVVNLQERVDISEYEIPFSQNMLNAIFAYVSYNVPEAFHVTGLSGFYYPDDNLFTALSFGYNCTKSQYDAMYEDCLDAADELLSGIRDNNSLTAVEKALLLHDRLALHCSYGNVNAARIEIATLYAALVGREPVCQGYAIAYSYLLNQVGIRSEIATSETLNHAWNIVYINNKPYHVDVTWDDTTPDAYGRVHHNNFLLSTSALKKGINGSTPHSANDYTTAPSDTTYDSYYWQNSEAAFQLLKNEIYYIDHNAQELRKTSNHAKICSVAETWWISSNQTSYLVGNFARLACVNNKLFCSMPTAVYEVNPQTGAMTEFVKPTLKISGVTYYNIYGFAVEGNTFYFDFSRGTSNSSFAKTQMTVTLPTCTHSSTQLRNQVNATCSKEGYTGDRYCNDCGAKTASGSVIPVTNNHAWNNGAVTKSATCTATGVRTYTCTVCSSKKTESIPKDATNHTGGTYTGGAINATCGVNGYTGDTHCKGCNAVLTKGTTVAATGAHSWNNGTVTTEATCHTKGTKTVTCQVCNATGTQEIAIDASNHAGGTTVKNAKTETCAATGYTGDTVCLGCSKIIASGSVIPVTNNHAWNNGVVTKSATCTETGVRTYTCTVCSSKKNDSIPMTAHTEITVPAVPATCISTGLTAGKKCSSCGKILVAQTATPFADHVDADLNSECDVCEAILEAAPLYKAGDVNGDGEITASDARTVLRCSVRLESLNEEQSIAADYDKDGSITSGDARSILRVSVGLDEWVG